MSSLQKLTIIAESKAGSFTEHIEALFNPSEINIQQSINWDEQPTATRDVPNSQHTNADPATLTLDLFFDTYEAATDVRAYTDKIVALTKVEQHGQIHRPPICQLSWGRAKMFFQGALQSLTQKFTLFLANGLPVRATLNCTFKQWRSNAEEVKRLDLQSADVEKRYTVKLGDTLSSIAEMQYDDAKMWRPIANANHIENPRVLAPGTVLRIPTLRPPRTTLL